MTKYKYQYKYRVINANDARVIYTTGDIDDALKLLKENREMFFPHTYYMDRQEIYDTPPIEILVDGIWCRSLFEAGYDD